MERKIGDYRIVREIGRGGMGIVYEAIQTSLDRRVALKVLAEKFFRSPRAVERFHREAAAAARLRHPNIVPVYDSGCEAGVYYYCMAYVEGRPLDALIAERGGRVVHVLEESSGELAIEALLAGEGSEEEGGGRGEPAPPPPRGEREPPSREACSEWARRLAEVADALDYAHRKGVVHLDIKPSNLILDEEDRVAITDFGLARLDEGAREADGERAMGSPLYASPEVIERGRDAAGPAADIYGLGVTLYECLTLLAPFAGPTYEAVLWRILHGQPVPPRVYNPAIPKDLDEITRKAMARRPEGRYGSASALARDLRRFVEGEPVDARPVGPVRRLARRVLRNRPLVIALAVAAILAVVAAVGLYFAFRPGPGADELYDRGIRALNAGDNEAALPCLRDARRLDPTNNRILRGLADACDRAAAEAPRDWKIRHELADVLRDLRVFTQARDVLRQAIGIVDADPQAATDAQRGQLHYDLGKVLEDLGEYGEAEKAFETAKAFAPDDARAWNMVGEMRMLREAWREAAEAFRHAVALRPDKAKYVSNQGLALLRLGDVEEARKRCREAVDIEPRNENWRLHLFEVEMARKDWGAAAEHLEAARRFDRKEALKWVRRLAEDRKEAIRREPAFAGLRADAAFLEALGE